MNRRPGAFTLIELLIVIAIISILASIAVPNFVHAQVRAKLARVQSDLQTISTALEAYASDVGEYPPNPVGLGPRFRAFRPLTTPVAYLTQLPRDPFQSEDPLGPLGWRLGVCFYGAMPLDFASRWLLVSDGPDKHLSCSDPSMVVFYPGYSPELFAGEVQDYDYVIYDPTNGVISEGDVYRASDHIFP